MSNDYFDLCIVGAGVIGLAIAEHIARTQPATFSILLLEKNSSFGQEISSRNSEVIHAGIYYTPGSLKANLCHEGRKLLYQYCAHYNIAHRKIGKFIVAQDDEWEELESIKHNAAANGVESLDWVASDRMRQSEPLVRAKHALYSSETGIIDSHAFMQSLLWQAQARGVQYVANTRVTEISPATSHFLVSTESGPHGGQESYTFRCTRLVNAAGLHANRLANCINGISQSSIPQLYMVRGCYFRLNGSSPFQHLIYPVPEKAHKGLGIHATLDMSGQVRFGPDVEYVDAIDYKVNEARREDFVKAIQRYYPTVRADQLVADYAGIRPKLSAPNARAADFLIQDASTHHLSGLVQLMGIESPGLTSALAIAKYVRERLGL